MEGGEWQRSCADVWFLRLLIPCFPANRQRLPFARTSRQFCTKKQLANEARRRREVQARGKEAAGSILPEGEGTEGAACHPGTAPSLACALAQDPSLISASQARRWHTTHTVKPKSPSAASLGVRDCLSLGSTHHFES